MRRDWALPWVILIIGGLGGREASADTASELAQQAYEVLKTACHQCHGGSAQKSGGVTVLNHGSLIATRAGDETPFVTPGQLEKSLLWEYVESGYMPQSGTPQATAFRQEDKEILKRWIAAGAPAWATRQVKPLDDRQVLTAIREHLLSARTDDTPYFRYFSLTHLHNNELIGEEELRLHRAALSKAINSMSWERGIVLPKAVPGTQESVFVIDLRQLAWQKRKLWRSVLEAYPYGMLQDETKDETLAELAKGVQRLAGHDELLVVRADWFIVTATRPPLYHEFLELPQQLSVLEDRVGLKWKHNFESTNADRQLLARGGFAQSGVSKQNRLVERHDLPTKGYWWISYDFLPRRARGDLVRFPLGPRFADNPFNEFAFDHDGGEVIFSLPNGLQAYLLVDAQGRRLDGPAPADVVFDKVAIAGLPAIINGLSCMNCHKDGMIRFEDEVRTSEAVGGRALQRVKDLYPPRDVMRKLVDKDRAEFLAALDQVCGPFLKLGDAAGKDITQFPEPIGRVAERYQTDLGPTDVALELGLADAGELRTIIRNNRQLLRFGLGTLASDPPGTMKRDRWEALEGFSLYQVVRQALGRGEIPTN